MNILYNIIIQPLIFGYDLLFTLLYRNFENPVISIILLSIVINIIVLPLYQKAEAIQKEEQEKKLSLESWSQHIRKHFSGDERFFILQAYYRIENYSPFSFLKEILPLFLQIPFFIAAYHFISSLDILNGASLGPIANLSSPDGLILVGGVTINLLPILMTVINLISGIIHSKGSEISQKIQIFLIALIFLILLYNSPSGLVIYWTMNNLFSLGKNILLNLSERKKKYVTAISLLIICVLIHILIFNNKISIWLYEIVVIGMILYIIQMIGKGLILSDFVKKHLSILEKHISDTSSIVIVLLSGFALAILNGLYIPSTVLSSSVFEFTDTTTGIFNYELLIYPLCIYTGFFLLWIPVVYFFNEKMMQGIVTVLLSTILIFSILNQFVFSNNFYPLDINLNFEKTQGINFSLTSITLNILAGILSLLICAFILYKKKSIIKNIAILVTVTLICISGSNIYYINNTIKGYDSKYNQKGTNFEGLLRLSKTEKNVIVFMLDRAIGTLVPYIFDEKPELIESFQGFIYYPNTLSFGPSTNFGSPPLYGGYEYTPYEMNKRKTEKLKDKHNEALKLMPIIFSKQGYDVTVCDPPFANYHWISDISIFDEYQGINAYNLKRKFKDDFSTIIENYFPLFDKQQKHNFVMYSLYRTFPTCLRTFIYDSGKYISNYNYSDIVGFIDNYSVLNRLIGITRIDNIEKSSFLLLQNGTPHKPISLEPPNYKFQINLTSSDKTEHYSVKEHNGKLMTLSGGELVWGTYCVNILTFITLAKWFDYLKKEGVYNNTRIILVSDHGFAIKQFKDLIHPNYLDIEGFNPLLMVKDFEANEPFTTNNEFMTNADVPTLAMNGIIENPVNPFTGLPISNDRKKDGLLYVVDSINWSIYKNNGTIFDLDGGRWWSVHDDIFNMNNWKVVDEKEINR